jgi:hypothetical protein
MPTARTTAQARLLDLLDASAQATASARAAASGLAATSDQPEASAQAAAAGQAAAGATDDDPGYLDLLGAAPQAGPVTGIAQRLMRTTALPVVYERYWRPTLGRLAKGLSGPSMADEHRYAQRKLELRPGSIVLDVACGTGGFTRGFAGVVAADGLAPDGLAPDGLAIGLDASRTMLARAVAETPPTRPSPTSGPTPSARRCARTPWTRCAASPRCTCSPSRTPPWSPSPASCALTAASRS